MKFLVPIASRYGAIFIQFVLVLLIARQLDVEHASVYFFISGLVLTLYFLTGLGLPDGVVSAFPREIEKGNTGAAFSLLRRSFYYSFLSALLISLLFGFTLLLNYKSEVLVIASAVWLLGYCLIFSSAQILIAIGRVQLGSFIFYSSINLALSITTVPYLLFSSQPSLENTLILNACSACVVGMGSLYYVFLQIKNSDKNLSTDLSLLKMSWYDGFVMACGRIIQAAIIWMPVWLSGAFLGAGDTSRIGLATRLLSVVGALLAAVRFSIRPRISQLAAIGKWKHIEVVVQRIALSATALSIFAVVSTAVLGEYILVQMFGNEYSSASILLLILLGAAIAESLGGPVDEVLKMTGKAKFVLRIQLICLILMTILGVLFSKIAGAKGISAAFSISFLTLYGIQIAFLYKTIGILALPFWKRN